MISGNHFCPPSGQVSLTSELEKDIQMLRTYLAIGVKAPNYIEDLISIYRFLHNNDLFLTQLDALEKALQDYTTSSPIADKIPKNAHGLFHLPEPNRPEKKNHKLLSSYLYAWAKEQGFSHKAKLIRQLRSDVFRSLLREQSFLKDAAPVLSSEHGIWTHMIQWWCIFQYHQLTTSFLQHTPMELYKQFGMEDESIWDSILDRGPKQENNTYTCPENVTNRLRYNPERWPLLSTTLQRHSYRQNFYYGCTSVYNKHIQEKHVAQMETGYVKAPL